MILHDLEIYWPPRQEQRVAGQPSPVVHPVWEQQALQADVAHLSLWHWQPFTLKWLQDLVFLLCFPSPLYFHDGLIFTEKHVLLPMAKVYIYYQTVLIKPQAARS